MLLYLFFFFSCPEKDLEMYHEESDTPALVRTMALNEELGQASEGKRGWRWGQGFYRK